MSVGFSDFEFGWLGFKKHFNTYRLYSFKFNIKDILRVVFLSVYNHQDLKIVVFNALPWCVILFTRKEVSLFEQGCIS